MLRAIGVTIGDPAGIGPELVAAICGARSGTDEWVVYGDRAVLEAAGWPPRSSVELVEVTNLAGVVAGKPTLETGRAQVAYLEAAVRDASGGRLRALVTAGARRPGAR